MAVADRLSNALRSITARLRLVGLFGAGTLSGALTLTRSHAQFGAIDPGGASRDVTLPTAVDGEFFVGRNTADGASENLVIKTPAAVTLSTVPPGGTVIVACEGTTWFVLFESWVSDTLAERTAAAGVTVDGVLLKDGGVVTTGALTAGTITEASAGAGVTADGTLLKDGGVTLGASGVLTVPDGASELIQGAGTGTGDVVRTIGAVAGEGLELAVYEATVEPAAVETNLLLLPAGSVILSVQANCETALTGGSTTVTWSIGTTGDPDKYGTAGNGGGDTLLANGKLDFLPDRVRVASAEQIVLSGAATGGASDGDTALTVGSVRVRIVYERFNSLADA